jgi:hypothetical protein
MTGELPPPDDLEFWEAQVSLLLSQVCTIERYKLKRRYTTAELRKWGKELATTRDKDRETCDPGDAILDKSDEL